MERSIVEIPGGLVDDRGRIHREAEIGALTGRDEELFGNATQIFPPAVRVTRVLQRCVRRIGAIKPVTDEVARRLLVADRQYLLLKLREMALGDRMTATIVCPWDDCGKKVTVRFSSRDIPVTVSSDKGPFFRAVLDPRLAAEVGETESDREVSFRLPTGEDQEAVCPLLDQNEVRAPIMLLQRCLLSIGRLSNPDEEAVGRLSQCARSEIEREMERVAPKVDLEMESTCPECGRDYTAPLDLQTLFFGELISSREALYREVHYLAYHYHWSEREILGMPRQKRRGYIQILSHAMENWSDVA